MRFRWNVTYRSGNAKEWCSGTLPSNLVKTTTPVHGDLIVFDAGVCGSDTTTGHVAVVDVVNASAASVTIVEENDAGRRSAKQSCALCYLHATANDGSTAGAGGASSGGAAAGGSANGGAASAMGGAANGGAQSGGRTGNGGSANGGAAPAMGGAASGGAANGGAAPAMGGAASGGAASGGAANGGTASGGSSSGGASSGGAAGGGAQSGGTSSAGSATGGSQGTPAPDDPVEGSCSCAVPGAPAGHGSGYWLGGLSALLGLFRRRKRQ
ncbi:MAG: CHAP domain-containing protein [Polyangiaceae bacterium]